MPLTSSVQPGSKTAGLSIHVVIVGGGIAGLSCAVALSRVGHSATVLERHTDIGKDLGGCRMPPNLSKVLLHWGLGEDLMRFGLKSAGIDISLFETGEYLGRHSWDATMLEETRGDFICSHYADLRRLLYDTALSCGVTVRMGAEVTVVDPAARRVKLANGEEITGDFIVGADGERGLTRKIILEAQDEDDFYEDEPKHDLNCYSSVIPREIFMQDPELAPLMTDVKRMFGWYGNGCSALLIPLNADRSAAQLFVYTPKDGNEGNWETEAPVSGLIAACANGDTKLQKLSKLAPRPPLCLPIIDYPELEDWVDDAGRLVVIGGAAHPLFAGGIQDLAMSLEDGAVLARLFSHIRTEDQISTLLYAFQDLRQPHVRRIKEGEMNNMNFMGMPQCEFQQGRDDALRTNRDAGLDAFATDGDQEELPQWAEIKEVFGYDAEDDADNWWIEWGLLRERARGTDLKFGFVEPVAIQHGRMSFSEPAAVY